MNNQAAYRFENHPWRGNPSAVFDQVTRAIIDFDNGITNPLDSLKRYVDLYGMSFDPVLHLAYDWMTAVYASQQVPQTNSDVLRDLYQDTFNSIDQTADLSQSQKDAIKGWFRNRLGFQGGKRRSPRRGSARKLRKARKSRKARK